MSLLSGAKSDPQAGANSNQSILSPASPMRGPTGKLEKLTREEKRAKSKARRDAKLNAALLLKQVLTDNKIALTADQAAALELLTKPPRAGSGAFGESIFNKIFGATPQVGQSATIQDVFTRTMKGVSQMNALVRRWAAKGVAVIEYQHDAANPFQSKYVIRSMGTTSPAIAES